MDLHLPLQFDSLTSVPLSPSCPFPPPRGNAFTLCSPTILMTYSLANVPPFLLLPSRCACHFSFCYVCSPAHFSQFLLILQGIAQVSVHSKAINDVFSPETRCLSSICSQSICKSVPNEPFTYFTLQPSVYVSFLSIVSRKQRETGTM